MTRLLQRTLTILLGICLVVGSLSYLQVNVVQLSCKIDALLCRQDDKALVILKVPTKDLSDQKNVHELWQNGKLYDVKSYVIINDTALVSAWQDDKETKIVNTIVSIFESNAQISADNAHHCQLSKYKTYIPDGKILTAPSRLTIHETFMDKPEHRSADETATAAATGNIIKPPPRAC